jgi:hypothetical protein
MLHKVELNETTDPAADAVVGRFPRKRTPTTTKIARRTKPCGVCPKKGILSVPIVKILHALVGAAICRFGILLRLLTRLRGHWAKFQ